MPLQLAFLRTIYSDITANIRRDEAQIRKIAFEMSGSLHLRAEQSAANGPFGPTSAASRAPAVSPGASSGFSRAPLSDRAAATLDVELQILDVAEAASEWRSFEAHADCTPFQTFGWLEKWQRHVGTHAGTLPAIVFGRDGSGEILFILPLAIETRGAVRRLVWLGSDLADYNAPLLSNRFATHPAANAFAAVWNSVVSKLQAVPGFRFDLINLEKLAEMVGAQKNPFLALKVLPNPSGAYVATLGRDWNEYYAAKRSSSTRKTARRKEKQLAEHGEIRFVEALDLADSSRTMQMLMDQKSRALLRMGVENFLARPGYQDFYLSMATDSEARPLVHISRLDVGKTPAATAFGLQFRGCYYLVLSSYQDGELSRFGPGRIQLNELLRHSIERGFRYFDFTIGDEPYKLDWSDTKLSVYDYIAASTVRGFPFVFAIICARRFKRFIKQTPVLWRAVSKARAFAGRIRARSPEGSDDERQ